MSKILRLIFGDQLNQKYSWHQQLDSEVTYVVMELTQETNYVKHHIPITSKR